MKRFKLPFAAESGFLITLDGRKRLLMEGCDRILRYGENEMILEGKVSIKVTGEKLDLKEVGNANILVEGILSSVEFAESGGGFLK